MALVLIGKDLFSEGSTTKIEDKEVPVIYIMMFFFWGGQNPSPDIQISKVLGGKDLRMFRWYTQFQVRSHQYQNSFLRFSTLNLQGCYLTWLGGLGAWSQIRSLGYVFDWWFIVLLSTVAFISIKHHHLEGICLELFPTVTKEQQTSKNDKKLRRPCWGDYVALLNLLVSKAQQKKIQELTCWLMDKSST